MAKMTRRNFFRGLAGGAVAVGGVGAYAHWGEPHWLELDHQTVPLAKSAGAVRPVRVLHLSDFHDSPAVSLDYIAGAIALGVKQRPDLILVTGDFFTKRISDASRYRGILHRLPVAAPTFACLGNHDGGPWSRTIGGYASTDEVRALLDEAGIVCLQNDCQELFINGRKWQIVGVGDFWSQACQPEIAFARAGERGAAGRILLNHNPDAKDLLRSYDWDLMLCGHTHGGQLRLPLIGTPFAPVSDKRYVEGLHAWDHRWIYLTHGVGNLHGLRFNCRPQVSVLELV
jgi:predicted MPP superfamily phosphohydrolase